MHFVHRAVQYAGFTVMPILGGYFSDFLQTREIPVLGHRIVLSAYTAPSFFLMLTGASLIVLILLVAPAGMSSAEILLISLARSIFAFNKPTK